MQLNFFRVYRVSWPTARDLVEPCLVRGNSDAILFKIVQVASEPYQ